MALTKNDVISTALTLIVSVFTYSVYQGLQLPIAVSYRGALVLLLVAGLFMCIRGGTDYSASSETAASPWIILTGTLGVLTFCLFAIAMVIPSGLFVTLMGTLIVVIWLLTTLHHLFPEKMN